MSTQQGNLWGFSEGVDAYNAPLPAPSRHDDPASSRAAGRRYADSGKLGGNMAIVLAILKRARKALTYREAWALANDAEKAELKEVNIVQRRLNDLRARGLVRSGSVRKCSASGNQAQEWEAV